MKVHVDGEGDVIVSPTGLKVIEAIVAEARGEGPPIAPGDAHPATRDRLIFTGLVQRTSYPGTGVELLGLTALGWQAWYAIEAAR